MFSLQCRKIRRVRIQDVQYFQVVLARRETRSGSAIRTAVGQYAFPLEHVSVEQQVYQCLLVIWIAAVWAVVVDVKETG